MAMDETGPEEPLTPEDFADVADTAEAADTPQPLAFPCPEGETGRLDQWLAGVSGISRSRIQTLLRQGAVRTAANAVPTGRRATPGETYIIHLPPPEPVELLPENIPLDILYEDETILVVNKPAGLVVHPAAGHPHGTLVNALLYHCPGMLSVGGEARPGIVHRLDQDTSGLLVVAKRDDALNALSAAFQAGEVHKTYAAICCGVPEPSTGSLESLIGRSPYDRKKMAVVDRNGKWAHTEYAVEEDFGGSALLRVRIHTGRTHQIRVHLKSIRCPVAGDRLYGSASEDSVLPFRPPRQMLHARLLTFPHPLRGDSLTFEAPLPDDMLRLLTALRRAAVAASSAGRLPQAVDHRRPAPVGGA